MAQERLLETAIREFGTRGLDGVSTREIAKAANTAMSTITYHYGGKEQLYHAAAQRIAEVLEAEFAPVLDAEENVDTGDHSGARAAIQRIVGRFVEMMASTAMSDHAMFIAREQMAPTPAFDVLYGGIVGRIVRRVRELVCIATGAKTEAATHATVTLIGQAIVMRSSRATVLKLFDVATLDAARLGIFQAQVAANIDAILDRMAQAHGKSA